MRTILKRSEAHKSVVARAQPEQLGVARLHIVSALAASGTRGILERGPQVHQGAHHHQGHRDAGRCPPLRRTRFQRHRRVESRRALDGLRSIDTRGASEIVAAVNGKIPVMIDSGFRRGSDILKALALGADAVWLGRAARWALGAFGPVGCRAAGRHLFKELLDAAAATGKTTLASIDTSIVKQNWP